MSIALNNSASARSPLSLLRAAWSTLTTKVRRDGLTEFGSALIELCLAEQPFAAIARHCEVVAFFQSADHGRASVDADCEQISERLSRQGFRQAGAARRHASSLPLHDRQGGARFPQPVFTDSYLLWSKQGASGCYGIKLIFNKGSHYEGDLSVIFTRDDRSIFEISFAVVPGSAIGSSVRDLLFIGRVQGGKDQFANIRQATKDCGDVAPQHMLMVALHAIALSPLE